MIGKNRHLGYPLKPNRMSVEARFGNVPIITLIEA